MVQDVVKGLLAIGQPLSDDLSYEQIRAAQQALEELQTPLAEADVRALLSLLPPSGDTAFGLSWTTLHAIEAAPCWPLWDAVHDGHNEWTQMLLLRLTNGGFHPPN